MSDGHDKNSQKFDPLCYEDIEKVADVIKSKVNLKEVPTIGIICGSGLGGLAELVAEKQVLPYSEIPGFPQTKVVGHEGNVVFGYLSGKYVMCIQGRFHPYEHAMQFALCALPVRIMHLLGVKTLIVSNAAGGVNENFKLGDVMIIKDHIFLPAMCGFSPFIGADDKRFGSTFISMHGAYDSILRRKALEIAKQQGISVVEGVYCMTAGPQYETPAEVRMLKGFGADALGMSTCHEVAVARQQGMRVFGLSVITNIANLDLEAVVEVSHMEVLNIAKEANKRVCKFVEEIIKSM
uniref:Purine nucleoside phosphorylase n=1 Tax=Ascaris lumbricoides TaxID=6252 RepID=A0A0M3I3G9_ASCLU